MIQIGTSRSHWFRTEVHNVLAFGNCRFLVVELEQAKATKTIDSSTQIKKSGTGKESGNNNQRYPAFFLVVWFADLI